jgi:DNA primase
MDRSDYRFSRREVRESTGFCHTQLKLHLQRLEELEYVLVHRGGRGQSFVYELLYQGEGKDGSPFLVGLLDSAKLAEVHEYEEKKSGSFTEKSGVGRPSVGGWSGPGRGGGNCAEPHGSKTGAASVLVDVEDADLGDQTESASYVPMSVVMSAAPAGAR